MCEFFASFDSKGIHILHIAYPHITHPHIIYHHIATRILHTLISHSLTIRSLITCPLILQPNPRTFSNHITSPSHTHQPLFSSTYCPLLSRTKIGTISTPTISRSHRTFRKHIHLGIPSSTHIIRKKHGTSVCT